MFYRYSDGSEYYRRKSGRITFRPPVDPPEKVEGKEDLAASPSSATTERVWRPWYDWPPQLTLSVKTDGNSIVIRDSSGSTITFEPADSSAEAGLAPARDRFVTFYPFFIVASC